MFSSVHWQLRLRLALNQLNGRWDSLRCQLPAANRLCNHNHSVCAWSAWLGAEVPFSSLSLQTPRWLTSISCDLKPIGIWIISVNYRLAFACSVLRSAVSRALANYGGHQQQKQTPAPSKLIRRVRERKAIASCMQTRPAQFRDAFLHRCPIFARETLLIAQSVPVTQVFIGKLAAPRSLRQRLWGNPRRSLIVSAILSSLSW